MYFHIPRYPYYYFHIWSHIGASVHAFTIKSFAIAKPVLSSQKKKAEHLSDKGM